MKETRSSCEPPCAPAIYVSCQRSVSRGCVAHAPPPSVHAKVVATLVRPKMPRQSCDGSCCVARWRAARPPCYSSGMVVMHTLMSICLVLADAVVPASTPLRVLLLLPAPYGLKRAVAPPSPAVRSRSPSLSMREMDPPALCLPEAPLVLLPRRAADIAVLCGTYDRDLVWSGQAPFVVRG